MNNKHNRKKDELSSSFISFLMPIDTYPIIILIQVQMDNCRWWAPEQFSGTKETLKSDVWAFGVVLWEIYSRAGVPYDGG